MQNNGTFPKSTVQKGTAKQCPVKRDTMGYTEQRDTMGYTEQRDTMESCPYDIEVFIGQISKLNAYSCNKPCSKIIEEYS